MIVLLIAIIPELQDLQRPLFNPFPNDKFFTLPNKEFTDNNLRFDENSRMFSERVENTVGKGEITCKEQFLLFPQCFSTNFENCLPFQQI